MWTTYVSSLKKLINNRTKFTTFWTYETTIKLTWTSSLRLLCDRSRWESEDKWHGLSFNIVARYVTVLPVKPHWESAMYFKPSGLFASPVSTLIAPGGEDINELKDDGLKKSIHKWRNQTQYLSTILWCSLHYKLFI